MSVSDRRAQTETSSIEDLAETIREAVGDLYGQGDVRFNGKPALKLAHEALDSLVARVEALSEALRGIEAFCQNAPEDLWPAIERVHMTATEALK